jgi:membrane protease subunit HflC
MSRTVQIIVGVVVVVGLFVLWNSVYVVDKTEQVVLTQFGDPEGLDNPIDEPGLHFKLPFVQRTNYMDKRYLEWDGYLGEITTKDKRFIKADTYARWRIEKPVEFYESVRTERRAQSRLDDIIDGATRDTLANNDLLELVRLSNRTPQRVDALEKEEQSNLREIGVGREKIMDKIEKEALSDAKEIGIEVLDIRFKKINYNDNVRKDVFNRMTEERKRIAQRYRSEGEGEAADIRGKMERELEKIRSEAEKKAEKIRGEADGKVTKIYADAYSKDPEFFQFLRTLETYPDTLDEQSWLLMSTESSFFKYLKQIEE